MGHEHIRPTRTGAWGITVPTGMAKMEIQIQFDSGEISAEQFVELNERVGGFDARGQLSPERADAPLEAVKNAHAFGRINNAGGGLAEIPIIPDFRFGYGTFTHPSSRHALIVAGSA